MDQQKLPPQNVKKFEKAILEAAKQDTHFAQLETFLDFYAPPLLQPLYEIYPHLQNNLIALCFQQQVTELLGNDNSKLKMLVFPTQIASQIKELFWPNSPFEFLKFIQKKIEQTGFIQVSWETIFRLYGKDPNKVLLDAIDDEADDEGEKLYSRIWANWDKLYIPKTEEDCTDPSYKQSLNWYNETYSAYCKRTLIWYERLLSDGKNSLAEKLYNEFNSHSENSFLQEIKRSYGQQMLWHQLRNDPEFWNSPQKQRSWLNLALRFSGKKNPFHKNCPLDLMSDYITVLISLDDWQRISCSNDSICLELSESLWNHISTSRLQNTIINCLEKQLKTTDISVQIRFFKFLFTTPQWFFFNNPESDTNKYNGTLFPTKIVQKWLENFLSIGERFLNRDIKLSFEQLLDWFDLARDIMWKNREFLVPYADKILAYARPFLFQTPEKINIRRLDDPYRILLSYAPDKLLRNLLQTFIQSPLSCSGDGLQYGVGRSIRYYKNDETTPVQWWISVLISNCLRRPFIWIENQKFKRLQGNSNELHDQLGNLIDSEKNIIPEPEIAIQAQQSKNIVAEFCWKKLRLKKGIEHQGEFYNNADCMEPNALWRQAFCRALNEIGVDLGGKVHRTLDFVRKSDPDEEVRKVATEAYKAVRRQHHKNEVDPVKGLLIAFWWLRLAQRRVLGQAVIPANATKTRRNELRYADQVKTISDDLFYLFSPKY